MKWLVSTVITVTCLLSAVRAQDPEIVDEIWPEVQPIGRTGRINCTVANLKKHSVQWKHINSNQVVSIDETINIHNPMLGGLRKYAIEIRRNGDRITNMLMIRRLRQQDAGHYECAVRIQAVSDQSIWPKKLGKLTVQVAPTIRSGETTAVLQVDQGHNSSLECRATGIPLPNITWTRSDGGLLPVLPKAVAQYRSWKLPLVSVGVEHMGVYRCVADNNIKPPAEHLAEVLVFHPPKTRVVQNSVGQAQNRKFDAKLECIVQGHPEPTVSWERLVKGGRVRITDDDKYDINKQTTDNQNLKALEQWYTLKVKNVQGNDYTQYFCIAHNMYGKTESVITLFETSECQGPNCPSLPSSRAPQLHHLRPAAVLIAVIFYLRQHFL